MAASRNTATQVLLRAWAASPTTGNHPMDSRQDAALALRRNDSPHLSAERAIETVLESERGAPPTDYTAIESHLLFEAGEIHRLEAARAAIAVREAKTRWDTDLGQIEYHCAFLRMARHGFEARRIDDEMARRARGDRRWYERFGRAYRMEQLQIWLSEQ